MSARRDTGRRRARRGTSQCPLELDVRAAASAVLELAIERMVQAIEEITLTQGIDPRDAVTIGGGGWRWALRDRDRTAARQSPSVVIPAVSAALSASGALLSDLRQDFAITHVMSTTTFDLDRGQLPSRASGEGRSRVRGGPGADAVTSRVVLSVEARYPHQVWDIEVPLSSRRFTTASDVESLREAFHRAHERIFAVSRSRLARRGGCVEGTRSLRAFARSGSRTRPAGSTRSDRNGPVPRTSPPAARSRRPCTAWPRSRSAGWCPGRRSSSRPSRQS